MNIHELKRSNIVSTPNETRLNLMKCNWVRKDDYALNKTV